MEKNVSVIVAVLLAGLLLSIGLGAYSLGMTRGVEYVDVEVPVEVPVEVEVEVEKDLNSILNKAVEVYLSEVRDDLDQYEAIVRVDVDKAWSMNLDEDYKSVSFQVDYRVIDTLTNDRQDYSCAVLVEYDFDLDEVEVSSVC